MTKDVVIEELRRVAEVLDTRYVSRSMFARRATISSSAVEGTFGSWNEAIKAAGLTPLPQGGLPKSDQRRLERLSGRPISGAGRIADDDLLDDLVRLAKDLGRRPSGNQVSAKGKYGRDVYVRRWGSIAAAYEAALARG